MSHAEQLFLRVVLVLALPKSVGPLAEKRRRTGQFSVSADDFVKLRPVEKVVVHFVGYFRTEVERAEETIVEAAPRGVVPEDAVAVARQDERDADVRVVLRNIHCFAAIIPNAGLMLPKPVKRFI